MKTVHMRVVNFIVNNPNYKEIASMCGKGTRFEQEIGRVTCKSCLRLYPLFLKRCEENKKRESGEGE